MKKIILIIGLICMLNVTLMGKEYKVVSPNGMISVNVNSEPSLSFSVTFDGKIVVENVTPGMVLKEGGSFGNNETVRSATYGTIDQTIEPVIPHKHSVIKDKCNTLLISFRSGFSSEIRVYDDGFAYRIVSTKNGDITIENEIMEIKFPDNSYSWFPYEDSFMSHNERQFVYSSLDTISSDHLASLPALFVPDGVNVLVTEAAVEDYPGMWLKGGGGGKINGVWPAYPKSEELRTDRNLYVTSRENFIAVTKGKRNFPWRVFVISGNDGGLIESDMVFKLGEPNRLTETDWIKPGKVAWDWWNFNNIYNVGFRAGVNTETYKYYIDFAASNGLEYIILDEGWYKLGNVLDISPDVDVEELCRYANSKNVGVILWVVWKTFYDQMDEALKQFSSWGAKGVKVDFMQRDDQKMVNIYYDIAAKTAEYQMLVDFHGCYKPDGLRRTYPNVITREGVKGLEQNKWSNDITPAHDLTIPFTRMVAGPMDYTPGAMVNLERNNFRSMYNRPASQGTRVHQMALYVIYESPLQMLADNPTNYMREQECTDFIAKVPVVWDDLVVLEASISKYLVLARKSGDTWYLGGLTDWSARDFEIVLSFLGEGNWVLEEFSDGINADRFAQDYKHSTVIVNSSEKINLHMAPGGGWAAKLVREK